MRRGHDFDNWQHTSCLLAFLANLQLAVTAPHFPEDETLPDPYEADDFNPMLADAEPVAKEDDDERPMSDLSILNQIWG